MKENFVSNLIVSFALVAVLVILAFSVSDINLIINIAAGLFGIPMIFLFPTLIGIKKWYFKNDMGKIFLYIWGFLWIAFAVYNLYDIITGLIHPK